MERRNSDIARHCRDAQKRVKDSSRLAWRTETIGWGNHDLHCSFIKLVFAQKPDRKIFVTITDKDSRGVVPASIASPQVRLETMKRVCASLPRATDCVNEIARSHRSLLPVGVHALPGE